MKSCESINEIKAKMKMKENVESMKMKKWKLIIEKYRRKWKWNNIL